jgi:hypothetical protein
LINKKQNILTVQQIYPKIKNNNKQKYTTLTYFGPLSDKIANILSNNNHKIAFKSSQQLSSIFFNVKDKRQNVKKSGVYRLNCSECSSCYIGQTGRSFEKRYKEHYASFRLEKRNSNFANHFLDHSHSFPDITQLEILHYEQKSKKLNSLESIEIFKNNKKADVTLLNSQTDLIYSPLLKLL